MNTDTFRQKLTKETEKRDSLLPSLPSVRITPALCCLVTKISLDHSDLFTCRVRDSVNAWSVFRVIWCVPWFQIPAGRALRVPGPPEFNWGLV